jgi:hypothetical protein
MSIGRGTATGGLPTSGAGWYIDLSTGAIVGTPSWTVSVQPAGSGYFRVSGTFTATATSAGDGPAIYLQDNTGASFAGDGTSGIFIWGAQLSDSASLDPYVYNPGAAPASTAYFGPRFDYDPVTLAPKGLLIEEQRTNLWLQSADFDSASWSKVRGSITANATTSPDGTVSGDKFIPNTDANTHLFRQDINVTSGVTYTWTIYAKAAELNQIQLEFGGDNGAFSVASGVFTLTGSGSVSGTGSISNAGNGWYRCTVSAAATATASGVMRHYVGGSVAGNNVNGVFVWGAQLEAGAFATSYIPTTTAAATRAADVAVMQGANFSNWYVQNDGTFFAEFISNPVAIVASVSGERGIIEVSSGFARGHYFRATTTLSSITRDASGTYIPTTVAIIPGAVQKIAGIWGQDLRNHCVNGGTVFANTTLASVPENTRFAIGDQQIQGGSPRQLNGHIRRLAFFPRRLANAELTAITS